MDPQLSEKAIVFFFKNSSFLRLCRKKTFFFEAGVRRARKSDE